MSEPPPDRARASSYPREDTPARSAAAAAPPASPPSLAEATPLPAAPPARGRGEAAPSGPASSRRVGSWRLAAALAVAVLGAVAIYWTHFDGEFHFDDAHTVESNLYIRSLANLPCFFFDGVAPCETRAVATFSALPSNASYRPLVTASLAVDHALGGGLDPFWFHVTNFAAFLALGLTVFAFFRRATRALGKATGQLDVAADAIALVGATLLLWHPVSVETVAYVIARSDLLSTLGVVLAFVLYTSPTRWVRRAQLYLIPFILGVLAKPTALMFGPLLVAWGLWVQAPPAAGRSVGRALGVAMWRAAPALVLGVALFALLRHMERGFFEPGGAEPWRYVLTQPWIYVHYTLQWILPVGLTADTDLRPLPDLLSTPALVGYAFVLGLCGLMARALWRPSLRPYAFGAAWFLLALAPTTFVPLAEVANDHRMLFPGIGLLLAAGWGGWRLLHGLGSIPRRAALAGVLCVALAYAAGARARCEVWRTEESLWRDVTEKSPGNGRGHMNYGLTLMRRGDMEGAEAQFRRALELLPTYAYAHTNLAIALAHRGDQEQAERHHLEALRYGPRVPDVHYYYGAFLADRGRGDEAVTMLTHSATLSASYLPPRERLMRLHLARGELEQAQAQAEEILRAYPGHEGAREALEHAAGPAGQRVRADREIVVGLGHYDAGDFAAALAAFERAAALAPQYPQAHNNVCATLNELKKHAAAAAACRRALELDPDFAHARGNLGAALRALNALPPR